MVRENVQRQEAQSPGTARNHRDTATNVLRNVTSEHTSKDGSTVTLLTASKLGKRESRRVTKSARDVR